MGAGFLARLEIGVWGADAFDVGAVATEEGKDLGDASGGEVALEDHRPKAAGNLDEDIGASGRDPDLEGSSEFSRFDPSIGDEPTGEPGGIVAATRMVPRDTIASSLPTGREP